jgi:hypothetical protein
MHIVVRILLLLLALPLLFVFVMAPFIAVRSIGIASLGILVGSFGVALAGAAILTPDERIPNQELTGIPNDGELPEGIIATRFWQGFFGNKPAAILIDSTQHEFLFVGCLGNGGSTQKAIPEVRLAQRDIKGVCEQIFYVRGSRVVNLHIYTKQGRLRLDKRFQNYDQVRDYFVSNYPKTSKIPFVNLAIFPYFLIFAACAGLFLGYQFGTSIGQSIHPGSALASDEWGAAGAIFGPVVAILICYGFGHLVDSSNFDA